MDTHSNKVKSWGPLYPIAVMDSLMPTSGPTTAIMLIFAIRHS